MRALAIYVFALTLLSLSSFEPRALGLEPEATTACNSVKDKITVDINPK
jgi:hypothetical protein